MGMVFFLKCIAFSSLEITFTLNLMKRLENGFIPRSEYTPEKALLVIFDRYMAFESKPLLQLRGKLRIKVTFDIFWRNWGKTQNMPGKALFFDFQPFLLYQ